MQRDEMKSGQRGLGVIPPEQLAIIYENLAAVEAILNDLPADSLPSIRAALEPIQAAVNNGMESEEDSKPILLDQITGWTITLGSALKDAASDLFSLAQDNKKHHLAFLLIVSFIAFIASLELNGSSAVNNTRQIRELVFSKKCPKELRDPLRDLDNPTASTTKLTNNQIKITVVVSSLIALWCIFSESLQAYSFTQSVGKSYKLENTPTLKLFYMIFAIFVAVFACLTRLATENTEASINIAKLFLPKEESESHLVCTIIAYILAGPFALLTSLLYAVQAFSIIRSMLGINSFAGQLILAFPCLTEIYAGMSFSGKAMIQQVYTLSEDIKNRHFDPIRAISTIISLSLAIFLAYIKRTLNIGYYSALVRNDFKVPAAIIPDKYFVLLGGLIVIAESLLTLASLNPQLEPALKALYEKITAPAASHGEYPAAVALNIDATQSSAPAADIHAEPSIADAAAPDIESGIRYAAEAANDRSSASAARNTSAAHHGFFRPRDTNSINDDETTSLIAKPKTPSSWPSCALI